MLFWFEALCQEYCSLLAFGWKNLFVKFSYWMENMFESPKPKWDLIDSSQVFSILMGRHHYNNEILYIFLNSIKKIKVTNIIIIIIIEDKIL